MKSILGLLVLAIYLVGSSAFKAGNVQVNFSGVWKLNVEKSKFGDIPLIAAAQEYQVEQNKKEIILKWTAKNQKNKDISSSQKLLFDGTSEKTLLPNLTTRIMNANVDFEKNTLTVNKFYSKPNNPDETVMC